MTDDPTASPAYRRGVEKAKAATAKAVEEARDGDTRKVSVYDFSERSGRREFVLCARCWWGLDTGQHREHCGTAAGTDPRSGL